MTKFTVFINHIISFLKEKVLFTFYTSFLSFVSKMFKLNKTTNKKRQTPKDVRRLNFRNYASLAVPVTTSTAFFIVISCFNISSVKTRLI